MKKITAFLLTAVLIFSLYACGEKEGDLGKQTSVDSDNGYTVIQEVLPFKYSNEEDALKKSENAKTSGFVTTEENASGKIATKNDALEVAKKEVSDKYNTIKFAFDRTRGVWKVTFLLNTVEGNKTESSAVMAVYVDEDGYTLATVK